jgi:cytochrome oxidase Cu insertion factor (SCO1/SenC/PrrC family)
MPQAKAQTHRSSAGSQQRPGADHRSTRKPPSPCRRGDRQAVGDFVLLDRQGRPVELSRYRGKPLLVTFIYTACFQVCPTITRNLQKAVDSTVSVMGADRFNVISIGFNQPFDSPAALRDFCPAVRHPPAQLGVPEPCPGDRRRSDRQFRLQLRRHAGRLRPHQPGDTGRRRRAGSSARSTARSLPPKTSPNRSSS